MYMKKLAFLYMIFIALNAFSQKDVCNNFDDLYSAMNSIIEKYYSIDASSDSVNLYFTLKIDSTGEILSCHLLRTPNMNISNIDENYLDIICVSIENWIRVPFLYNNESFEKYCRWNIPFIKPPQKINNYSPK